MHNIYQGKLKMLHLIYWGFVSEEFHIYSLIVSWHKSTDKSIVLNHYCIFILFDVQNSEFCF